jgi:hypothetical protein
MTHNKVTGCVIDALEYFMVANLTSPVYLVLLDIPHYSIQDYKQHLLYLINNRYNYPYDLSDKIKIVPKIELIKQEFNEVVILDWGTITHIRGLLRAKHITIVTELTDSTHVMLDNSTHIMLDKQKYNVTYFTEMPFAYCDEQYTMKFAFEFFKPLSYAKEAIYVNCPGDIDNMIATQYVERFNKPYFFKQEQHVSNLFEQFDEYIYYHSHYFDPHPRLFHECFFYEKRISYINAQNIQDGSYYRFNDLAVNKLRNRYLDSNDEIIRILGGKDD